MKTLIGLFVSFFVLAAANAQAQVPPYHGNLSVSGEASADFAPDQALLSVAILTRDLDLKKAKQAADSQAEKLLAVAREFKIPKEKIATSSMQIAPEYNYEPNNKRRFLGYMVQRSLTITIDALEIHERLLSALVDANIDQVQGIEFKIADPEAKSAALRLKAYENAKTKAEAMAKAASVKLGLPVAIAMSGEQPNPPMPMPRMAMAKMEASSVAPSLPGMITLRETVSVTFGLE